jgi:hypothetical protein
MQYPERESASSDISDRWHSRVAYRMIHGT